MRARSWRAIPFTPDIIDLFAPGFAPVPQRSNRRNRRRLPARPVPERPAPPERQPCDIIELFGARRSSRPRNDERHERQLELFARRHEPRAMADLMVSLEPFLQATAKKLAATLGAGEADIEDMVSEGRIALMQVFDRFDPDFGVTIAGYASRFVERAMVTTWSNGRSAVHVWAGRFHRARRERTLAGLDLGSYEGAHLAGILNRGLDVSLDAPAPSSEDARRTLGDTIRDPRPTLDEAVDETDDRREAVLDAIERAGLDERERYVVEGRMRGLTLRALGKQMEKVKGTGALSRERVRQISDGALAKLRTALNLPGLDDGDHTDVDGEEEA